MYTESIDHAGLILAHQQLIDIWQSSKEADALPQRNAFDPGRLRMHLGFMSMAEIEADGDVRYRFAGSRLRRFFGGDSRGRRLSSLQNEASTILGEGIAAAIYHQQPTHGETDLGQALHVWLRLPLAANNAYRLVLCHDQFFEKSSAQTLKDPSLFELSNTDSFMAA